MEQQGKCLIWPTHSASFLLGQGDYVIGSSYRAGGQYKITGSAAPRLRGLNDFERARLTTWLTEQRRLGEEAPAVTSLVLQEARNRKPLSIRDRCDRALLFMVGKLETIDGFIPIEDASWVAAAPTQDELSAQIDASGHGEWRAILRFLGELGWMWREETRWRLTVKGAERLDEIERLQGSTEQAFVAMWFNQETDRVYTEGFAPAIRDVGYRPLRIDQKEHIQKIDDEIIAEIRRSRFVVADFTSPKGQPRGGVYFEAGFAMGVSIPVIWSCRTDRIEYVHFDTRQFNHIVWTDPDDLRAKLAHRIGAVIGDGPLKGM